MGVMPTALLPLFLPQLLLHAVAEGSETVGRSPLSEYGTQVCTGMVEAFLHKGKIKDEEVNCLVSAMGDVALGAYESAENVASLFEQISGLGGASQAAASPAEPLVVLRLAKSMQGLVHMMDGALGSCVRGHSLRLLDAAGRHLGNLTYMAGRLAANGVDIVQELSHAVDALRVDDYGRFGRDMGTACRKVLISNAATELLPEGPPALEELVNVAAGILEGFFGAGFELDVGSDAPVAAKPRTHTADFVQDGVSTGTEESQVVVSRERARPNVHVDLHRCVSENLGLFRAVMSKAWHYFAEAAVAPQDGARRQFLAVMLQGLPGAFARCGVEPQQQDMLADAIRELRHLQLRLQMPESYEHSAEAARHLRSAASHWSELNWFLFGDDLGRMLQGLALKAYPHRYALTSVGAVRQAEHKAAAVAKEAYLALRGATRPTQAELVAGDLKPADGLGAGGGLSTSGVQVVEGVAEGVLHVDRLSRPEAECLVRSAGGVLDGAAQAAQNLVEAFDEFFASGRAGVGELRRSLDGAARLAEGFMTECRSDAAEAFGLALEHLGSLQYVTGRIVANGADVNDGIDRAVASMKRGEPRAFGREVGRICRKVLLSNSSKPVLPEGDATLPQIVNVSAGMLEGFFGEGFKLDITSDQKLQAAPALPLAALLGAQGVEEEPEEPQAKRLKLHIDLHSCVKSNLQFFQSIVLGAVQFLAMEDVAPSQGNSFNVNFLMASMMKMPTALQRCGLSAAQETMLMESVTAFGSLHMRLEVPRIQKPVGPTRAAQLLKTCVSDWSRLQWFALGKGLGKMLREALLTALPHLYTVDGLGRLLGRSEAGERAPSRELPGVLASAAPLLLAGALVLAAAMTATRVAVAARRRRPAASLEAAADSDFEAGLVRERALE